MRRTLSGEVRTSIEFIFVPSTDRFPLLSCFCAVIEKFTDNVRFCLICNYMSKITPAIQSRCTRFRFGPLQPDQILPRMNHVIAEEK